MIIINADDFGYSENVNRAITDCLKESICSSTSIMPTGPSFEEACALAGDNRFTDTVGIHFTLVEHTPLTDDIRKLPRFCTPDGTFHQRRNGNIMSLTGDEKAAVARELREQIRVCRDKGLHIPFADSHQHMHEEWGLAPVFMEVCLAEKIPFIRLARNMGRITRYFKRLYRKHLNSRFRKADLARTDYFGSAADYEYFLQHAGHEPEDKSFEIMVHPDYRDDVLVDLTDGKPLAGLKERFISS